MQGLIFRGTGKFWLKKIHLKNNQELLMDNLPEIYFQVNDSNALKSIACVADVILIATVSV